MTRGASCCAGGLDRGTSSHSIPFARLAEGEPLAGVSGGLANGTDDGGNEGLVALRREGTVAGQDEGVDGIASSCGTNGQVQAIGPLAVLNLLRLRLEANVLKEIKALDSIVLDK